VSILPPDLAAQLADAVEDLDEIEFRLRDHVRRYADLVDEVEGFNAHTDDDGELQHFALLTGADEYVDMLGRLADLTEAMNGRRGEAAAMVADEDDD
jgi:hypothetical protein